MQQPANRSVRTELIVLVLVGVVTFVLAAYFDAFERFERWAGRHESLDIDEILVAAALVLVAALVFAWRRALEARRLVRRHQQTERILAETTERYRSLYQFHPDAVYSVGPDGHFLDANPAATRLTGYSQEELTTMVFPELIAGDDFDEAMTAFDDVLHQRPRQVELSIVRRDGVEVELDITAVPIVVSGGVVGIYGIAEEVTERNRIRRELDRARRDAEQASEAKSLFLANMSHEVRSPLTSMVAAAELLAETGVDEEQQHFIDLLRRAGERLQRLVGDILDFSLIEAGRAPVDLAPFRLRPVVEECLPRIRSAAAEKGLRFVETVETDLDGELVGDPGRIQQIVDNLLDNAVKFTEHGWVELAISSTAPDADGGLTLVITVSDSGIGIAPHEHDRLFEAFTQGDPSITRRFGGTGLGLAICWQLVELLGGSIDVDSQPHSGSTFTVRLPVRRAVTAPA